MTGTTWKSRILGTAWPQHMNKPIAETAFANIHKVGLPAWSDADQTLAKGIQAELKAPITKGLDTELAKMEEPIADDDKRGGASDDIGDISWNLPTITLRYPSNIPGPPGHNWANAISMATPIAHKGVVAGAKVQAMTMLDILTKPELVDVGWDYFQRRARPRSRRYVPFIARGHAAATWLNTAILESYRPEMKKFYYDPSEVPHLSRAARHQVSHRSLAQDRVAALTRASRQRLCS